VTRSNLTISHVARPTDAPQVSHLVLFPPWSQSFDRIFRNEGVTGSNPPSSTESPGQRDF